MKTEDQKRKKAFDAFWCSGHPGQEHKGTVFHNDGECSWCSKHHYHCVVCGKIEQVG